MRRNISVHTAAILIFKQAILFATHNITKNNEILLDLKNIEKY